MSDQPAVPGTAPSEPDGGTARYSVPQAARRLGISERAVRKRITAGSLQAERDGAAWVVFLEGGTGEEPGGTEGGTARGTAEPEGGTGRNRAAEVDGRDVRLAVLEAQLSAERARADAAEARAERAEADRDGWRQQAERLVDLMRADRVLQLQDGATAGGGSAGTDPAEDAAVGPADGPQRAQPAIGEHHPAGGPVGALGRFLRSLVPFP